MRKYFLLCLIAFTNCLEIKPCLDSERGMMCTMEFNPVCGYTSKNCNSEDCMQIYGNHCSACANNSVLHTTKGQCEIIEVKVDEKKRCPKLIPNYCTKEYKPVCGFSSENCNSSECKKTYSNHCMACANGVFYSTIGECKVINSDNCTEEERNNSVCTDDYNPVCGHSIENCNSRACKFDYPNRCSACADGKILLANKGKIQCPPQNNEETFCIEVYRPVCGHVCDSNGCESKIFSNECFACKNGAAHYFKGICPE